MTMFITFTCEAGKTVGHDSDYWVNNASLRIWLRLSLLLVLHFVEWFIYSMSVNPVPSMDDVIFLMYYTCCTPGKKAARCLTFYYFSFLLDNAYSLYTYLFQLSLRHLLKNIHLQKKRRKLDACSSLFSLLLAFQIADKLFCLCHSLKPCLQHIPIVLYMSDG